MSPKLPFCDAYSACPTRNRGVVEKPDGRGLDLSPGQGGAFEVAPDHRTQREKAPPEPGQAPELLPIAGLSFAIMR